MNCELLEAGPKFCARCRARLAGGPGRWLRRNAPLISHPLSSLVVRCKFRRAKEAPQDAERLERSAHRWARALDATTLSFLVAVPWIAFRFLPSPSQIPVHGLGYWQVWVPVVLGGLVALLGIGYLLWLFLVDESLANDWFNVAVAINGFIAIFAAVYYILNARYHGSWFQPLGLSRIDAIYYAVGTFTTVGAGPLQAHSHSAELTTSLQTMLSLGVIALALGVAINRTQGLLAERRLNRGA